MPRASRAPRGNPHTLSPLQQIALECQPRVTDTKQGPCLAKGDSAAANATASPFTSPGGARKPDTARNKEIWGSARFVFCFFWWVFYYFFAYLWLWFELCHPPPKKIHVLESYPSPPEPHNVTSWEMGSLHK